MRHVHMTWSPAFARSILGPFAANSPSDPLVGGAK